MNHQQREKSCGPRRNRFQFCNSQGVPQFVFVFWGGTNDAFFNSAASGAGWLVWRGVTAETRAGGAKAEQWRNQPRRPMWTLWGNVYSPRDDGGSDIARELTGLDLSGHGT